MVKKDKLFKIKVLNTETRRVDYHSDLSEFDISWLKSMPNLKIDISEVYFRERRRRDEEKAESVPVIS